MNTRTKLLAAVAAVALSFTGSEAALAAVSTGTTAGTDITNTVTVNYKVGTVAQPEITKNNTFKVDRKINVDVAEVGNATTTVIPGSTAQVTTFSVTNLSNATLDFDLSAVNYGTAAHGGTDNFDVTNITIYLDADNSGTVTAGDTVVTKLDDLAAGDTKQVLVVADVPLGRATDDVAAVVLTATARETTGAALTETAGANNATTMDTVFGDGTGVTDSARDAKDSASDDFTVRTATLTVAKLSQVISDPVNNTTNPKAIPGAVVEYCIKVANASGGANALDVLLSDTLPSQTTYVSAFGVKINGSVDGSGNCVAGTDDGSYSSGVVSGTMDVNAGVTKTLMFRVTIN